MKKNKIERKQEKGIDETKMFINTETAQKSHDTRLDELIFWVLMVLISLILQLSSCSMIMS